jgi:hypothetical protein
MNASAVRRRPLRELDEWLEPDRALRRDRLAAL